MHAHHPLPPRPSAAVVAQSGLSRLHAAHAHPSPSRRIAAAYKSPPAISLPPKPDQLPPHMKTKTDNEYAHGRLPESVERRKAKWLANVRQKSLTANAPHNVAQAPELFRTRPQNGREGARNLFFLSIPSPLRDPLGFTVANVGGDFHVLLEKPTLGDTAVRPVFRIQMGIPQHDLPHLTRLGEALLAATSKRVHVSSRSDYDTARHYGCWRHYSVKAYWTADTQQEEVTPALDAFLAEIERVVGKRAMDILRNHLPRNAALRAHIIQQAYKDPALCALLEDRPALRQCAWLCLAFKEGCSEIAHLDFSDALDHYAIVGTLGKYTGGAFVLPQLRLIIPLAPGQLLFVRARYLLHHTTAYSGTRMVFTGFLSHAMAMQFAKGFVGDSLPLDLLTTL